MAELRQLTLPEVIRSAREVSLDLNPVGCFSITGQGFFLRNTSTSLVLTLNVTATPEPTEEVPFPVEGAVEVEYPYATFPTFSDLLYALQLDAEQYDFVIALDADYCGSEPTSSIVPFSQRDLSAGYTVKRRYYFSDETIDFMFMDFFIKKLGHNFGYTRSQSVEYWVQYSMAYSEVQHLILWASYWLLDRRRMNISSTSFLRGESTGEVKSTNKSVTMRVGDTFTMTETDAPGAGEGDFTSFWGDQNGYLTKLQLYIRGRLEKMFQDYSLRDNIIISTTFELEKHWERSSHFNSYNYGLSALSTGVLQ